MPRVYGLLVARTTQISLEIVVKLGQSGGDQPRCVRLRDAEPRCDLALLEIAEVAKAQRLAFTGVERAQAAFDGEAIIGGVEVVLRPGGIRRICKRERRPCLFRTQCFGKLVLVELRCSSKLRRRRVSAQVGGELVRVVRTRTLASW